MECQSCCGHKALGVVYSVEAIEKDLAGSNYSHVAEVGKILRLLVDDVEKDCHLPMGRAKYYLEEALGANSLAKEAHDKIDVIGEAEYSKDASSKIRSVAFELDNALKNACLREKEKER